MYCTKYVYTYVRLWLRDYEYYDYDDFASFSVKTKQKRNKTNQNIRKPNTKITVNYITCIIIITTIIIALSSLISVSC